MKYASFIVVCVGVAIVACGKAPVSAESDAPGPSSNVVEADALVSAPVVSKPSACPPDMVEIEGDYCPKVKEKCLYNVDGHGKRMKGPVDPDTSCGEYEYPSKCLSDKLVHMRYCIDRFEFPNKPDQIPQDWMTYFDAQRAAKSAGKRLCTAKEWTLAAEGPELKPLPYGDGYHRDSTACNIDRHYTDITGADDFKALGLKSIDVFQSRSPNDKMSQALRMFLVPSGSMPRCVSDYGVHDMSGNIDEWVENVGGITKCPSKSGRCGGWISGLKGGHVWHVRQASRPMTDGHGPTFGWYETGTRLCKDVD